MAVVRLKSVYKVTFTLVNTTDENDIVTRDLSFELAEPINDTATQESRFNAFKTAYMANWANYRDDEAEVRPYIGSLIQPTSWKDEQNASEQTVSEDVYKCTGVTGAYVTTSERYFE